MTPDVVVDVGNTRIKWGRCSPTAVVESASLPPEEPAAWESQAIAWDLRLGASWVLSGVHPQRREILAAWLRQRGDRVHVLTKADELPLKVALEQPDRAGIDRLLDAVAANAERPPGTPAVLIDAGSAVTVDYLTADGTFAGGAILPGFRLMAKALHDYTALLPQIMLERPCPSMPGGSTIAAMEAGVYWSVVGGIRTLIVRLTEQARTPPLVFLTGGDGTLIRPGLPDDVRHRPLLTLEGVRLAAANL